MSSNALIYTSTPGSHFPKSQSADCFATCLECGGMHDDPLYVGIPGVGREVCKSTFHSSRTFTEPHFTDEDQR